jgi:hypothetical protein
MNNIGHVRSSVPSPLYIQSHAGSGLNKDRRATANVARVVSAPTVKQASWGSGTQAVQRPNVGRATGVPNLSISQ